MAEHAKRSLDFITRLLSNSGTSWLVLILAAGPTIWLTFDVPQPGIAIGILAVLAGVLIFVQPTAPQKLLYIVVMTGLFYDETAAVKADAKAKDDQRTADQLILERRFASVIGSEQGAMATIIKNANSQFGKSIGKLEDLGQSQADIQDSEKISVNQLTGGNSFPWAYAFSESRFKDGFFPENKSTHKPNNYFFLVRNSGDFAIPGVDLEIVHLAPGGSMSQEFDNPVIIHVGTIPPQGFKNIGYDFWPHPANASEPDIYELKFYYAGGEVVETLSYVDGREQMRFDEAASISFAPAPCIVQRPYISKMKDYVITYNIGPTGAELYDPTTKRSVKDAAEQKYLWAVKQKCLAEGQRLLELR